MQFLWHKWHTHGHKWTNRLTLVFVKTLLQLKRIVKSKFGINAIFIIVILIKYFHKSLHQLFSFHYLRVAREKIKVSKIAYKGFRSILVSCRKHMENDPTSNMLFADNFLKASYVEIAKNS